MCRHVPTLPNGSYVPALPGLSASDSVTPWLYLRVLDGYSRRQLGADQTQLQGKIYTNSISISHIDNSTFFNLNVTLVTSISSNKLNSE